MFSKILFKLNELHILPTIDQLLDGYKCYYKQQRELFIMLYPNENPNEVNNFQIHTHNF